MTRAALYFRQSLDLAEGIDRQRLRCQALAAARGWEVSAEYVDNDTSASKARGANTNWSRMLEDARGGRFDVVVAVDLDRLLRSVNDLITLTETGAKVLTVDGEIDLTTADGEFRATMLAGIARFETRRKAERQKRANAAAALKGKRVAGRRPFGYDADGVTIRPAEAEAVRRGFGDFLLGLSLAEIARTWNAQGLTTGQGSPWVHQTIRALLKNPRYMGKRAHLGEIVAEAEWPAIVEESTWQAVNAVLAHPDRSKVNPRGRHLLSALAVCAICRTPLHATSHSGNYLYRCPSALNHVARQSKPVDEFVEAVIVARLSRPDARELLHAPATTDTGSLHVELVGVRERLQALAVDFADGSLTSAQLRAATERLRAREGEIEASLADAGRVDVLGDLAGVEDVASVWAALPLARRRAVVDALCTVVVHAPGKGARIFNPETVTIEWKA